jgi:ferric-dicitrate binding protein FerR (iron transport regulator)
MSLGRLSIVDNESRPGDPAIASMNVSGCFQLQNEGMIVSATEEILLMRAITPT